MSESKNESKVAGGVARAKSLTPAERKAIAQKAAASRWAGDIPKATHDGLIKLGELEIECAVLEDGRRVISERAMTRAFGGKRGGSHWKRAKEGGANLPVYLSAKNYSAFISNDLAMALNSPVKYKTISGMVANGLDATLLPQVCDVFLKARDKDELHQTQISMAVQADIIMRGLATVGIIALIDEATGYQSDRASSALAQILEAFIAKELQPYVPTFPREFYEEMFRLRKLEFPKDSVKRPQYFGLLTNDIIYKRLAPGVLDELKKITPKLGSGRHKDKLFQRLSANRGYMKLHAHLGSVVTAMKLSNDWDDFIHKLDRLHPRFGDTIPMNFEIDGASDNGEGL